MAEQKYQYVQALADRVAADPALAAEIKNDPTTTLRQLAGGPLPDTWIYRIVVLSLGLAVVGTVVAASVLAAMNGDKKLPEGVIAIGAAAGGALAGLLAPSPVRG